MFHRALGSRALVLAALIAMASLGLTACNTTAGAGQDVSSAGRAVTDTAQKAKSGL